MPAPYVKSIIEDLSTRVPAPTGVAAAIVIDAKKGPVNTPVLVTSQAQLLEWFTPNSTIEIGWDLAYFDALTYLKDSNRLWVVNAKNTPLYGGVVIKTAASENSNAALSTGLADPDVFEFGTDDCLLIYGSSPNTSNNQLSVQIITDAATVRVDNAFIINVYNKGVLVESNTVSRKIGQKDGYGVNIFVETYLENSNFIRAVSNPAVVDSVLPKAQATALVFAKGSDGGTVTDAERIVALNTLKDNKKYSIQLIMDGGNTTEPYQKAIDAVCAAREEATYGILSTPYEAEIGSSAVTDLLTYRQTTLNINSYLVGLYTPHQKVYDEFNDRYIYLDPSGVVAGAISKTATNLGWHWASAGYNRGIINTIEPVRSFLPGELDTICENQINPIISDPSRGIVIFDQQTMLSKASDLQEQSISNMINIDLRPSLREFLKDYIFEFNDEQTRNNLKTKIEIYMDGKVADRAVYSYYVQCDEDNNTASDIQSNRMNVSLFIKPNKPAKFITQKIIVTPYGVSFASLLN
jgi:phage tail sheath protein FI